MRIYVAEEVSLGYRGVETCGGLYSIERVATGVSARAARIQIL